MGTRCITVVHDLSWGEEEEVAVIYRHLDGYPTGHGLALAEFLEPLRIVNGLSLPRDLREVNGAPDLVARIVSHFNDPLGSVCVHAAGTRFEDTEFDYHLFVKDGSPILVNVDCANFPGLEGSLWVFREWCRTHPR